ncbi:hypothetical protein HK102_009825, partial [Quaeritorhiza haematococci]
NIRDIVLYVVAKRSRGAGESRAPADKDARPNVDGAVAADESQEKNQENPDAQLASIESTISSVPTSTPRPYTPSIASSENISCAASIADRYDLPPAYKRSVEMRMDLMRRIESAKQRIRARQVFTAPLVTSARIELGSELGVWGSDGVEMARAIGVEADGMAEREGVGRLESSGDRETMAADSEATGELVTVRDFEEVTAGSEEMDGIGELETVTAESATIVEEEFEMTTISETTDDYSSMTSETIVDEFDMMPTSERMQDFKDAPETVVDPQTMPIPKPTTECVPKATILSEQLPPTEPSRNSSKTPRRSDLKTRTRTSVSTPLKASGAKTMDDLDCALELIRLAGLGGFDELQGIGDRDVYDGEVADIPRKKRRVVSELMCEGVDVEKLELMDQGGLEEPCPSLVAASVESSLQSSLRTSPIPTPLQNERRQSRTGAASSSVSTSLALAGTSTTILGTPPPPPSEDGVESLDDSFASSIFDGSEDGGGDERCADEGVLVGRLIECTNDWHNEQNNDVDEAVQQREDDEWA